MTQTEPKCGKCGKVMTPENSHRRPELFTCDGCLDAIMGSKALRPLDTARNPIIMDWWYWATTRTGKLCGTGKFAKTIGSDDFTFFINGVGYSADAFTYELAATPPEIKELLDIAKGAISFFRSNASSQTWALYQTAMAIIEKIDGRPFTGVRHGFDCPKAAHKGRGHLHAENDDSPYHVDGVRYCGRCHAYFPVPAPSDVAKAKEIMGGER
jgi:hypothetical protein